MSTKKGKAMKALALTLLLAGQTPAPDRVAARCEGQEVVQVGTQPPRTIRYTLTFSADLTHRIYCYDRCLKEQTYPIAAIDDDRLTLADVQDAPSTRRLTYDRAMGVLHDDQSFNLGPTRFVRQATARCVPARYIQPPLAAR